MKRWRAAARAGAIVGWFAVSCWTVGLAAAQPSSSLTGTVTDGAGGVLVGATVTLADAAGATHVAATDAAGRYRVTNLPPGRVALDVAADGFESFHAVVDLKRSGQTLHDVALSIGIRQSVTVSSEDSGAEGAGDAATIAGRDLATLPNDPDALLRRLQELAGVSNPEDLVVTVDGFTQGSGLPRRDAIQAIRIVSSGFDAEFAEHGRGRIEILTKTGGTRPEGYLTASGLDDRLNAKNHFAPSRVPGRQRSLSGSIRSPLNGPAWSLSVYGDRSDMDVAAVINAQVLDPADLSIRRFAAVRIAPQVTSTAQVRTDFTRANGERFTASYSLTRGTARDQGLQGGFDLPSRAFDTESRQQALRLSWLKTRKRVVHDARLEVRRSIDTTHAVSTDAALIVLDAFQSGGNQDALFTEGRHDTLQASDRLMVVRGAHALKVGATLDGGRHREATQAGYAGTFLFGADVERDAAGAVVLGASGSSTEIAPIERYRRTLLHLPGYGPSQFTIGGGAPLVSYRDWWLGSFVQDDWTVSRRLTLSPGLRQSLQTGFGGGLNLAPRLAATWRGSDAGRDRIRAGTGLFHHRVPNIVFAHAVRYDGRQSPQRVVRQPAFFPDVPDVIGAEAGGRVRYLPPAALSQPRSIVSSLSWDHRVSRAVSTSIIGLWDRGSHLLRRRSVGATADSAAPAADRVFSYDDAGHSSRREWTTTVSAHPSDRINVSLGYTLASRRGNTEGPATVATNAQDASADDGPLSSDRRHRVMANVWLQLPRQVALSATVVASSGRPFDITTGIDDNGDAIFNDRPAFALPGQSGAVVTPFGVFDSAPLPGSPRIPRNIGREPGDSRVDLRVTKTISPASSHSSGSVEVAIDNLLNAANLGGIAGTLSSPRFGVPQRAGLPRRMTMSVAWYF